MFGKQMSVRAPNKLAPNTPPEACQGSRGTCCTARENQALLYRFVNLTREGLTLASTQNKFQTLLT